MKGYQIQSFGLEGLVIVDLPDPEPGPNQVLVKMHAFSLNYRDLLVVKGLYNPRMKLPQIPLSDGAGEVVAVGSEVKSVKIGSRVANTFFERWVSGDSTDDVAKSALGGGRDGVLAEYVVLHEDGVIPVPEHLTYREAATLPCAALTAWNALMVQGKIKAGDTVLTLGTGGVSIFALQFALLNGARVFITSSSDAKLAKARQLGTNVQLQTNARLGQADPASRRRTRSRCGGRSRWRRHIQSIHQCAETRGNFESHRRSGSGIRYQHSVCPDERDPDSRHLRRLARNVCVHERCHFIPSPASHHRQNI